MSDKLECPNCKKKSERDEYKFEYYRLGRVGKCKHCGKKAYVSTPARGILKDSKTGVARKRFPNA